MTRAPKITIAIASLAGSFLLCGFLFHTFALGLEESVYPRRGTYAFWLLIDEAVIADLPMPGLVGAPLYLAGCGDGPKLPEQTVFFESVLAADALVASASRHARLHGFTPGTPDDPDVEATLRADGRLLTVDVTDAAPGRVRVEVSLRFLPP